MRATVNTWMWGLGLALQMALLAVLMLRGVARRLPAFSVLIGFYAARSVALFVASGHVSRGLMGSLYDGLWLVDLLLQMLVIAEIVVHVARVCGGWTALRGISLAVMVPVAAASGWAAGWAWQTRGRASIDRGEIGLTILFALLFGWAAWMGAAGFLRREVEGLAVYGLVSGVAQVERYRAALVRDAATYSGWSYGLAVVYLVVLVFWLVTMPRGLMDRSTGRSETLLRGVERLAPRRGQALVGRVCGL